MRLLLGELRQGALESLMIDAVAAAASLPPSAVRQAAMVAHGIVPVALAALTEGANGLRRFALALMQPIAPMLAQPAADVADALRALGTAAFEWKVDGARVQVHKAGDDVRIFTRSRNDVTASAPEIVAAVRASPVPELILDGEAIALQGNGAPQPFQVTMRRFGRTLRRAGDAGVAAVVGIFLRLLALRRGRTDRSRLRPSGSTRCHARFLASC